MIVTPAALGCYLFDQGYVWTKPYIFGTIAAVLLLNPAEKT